MRRKSCVMIAGLVILMLPLQVAQARTDITVNRFNDSNLTNVLPQLAGVRARSHLGHAHSAMQEPESEAECTGVVTRYDRATRGYGCLLHVESIAERAHEFRREEVIERVWWRLHRQRERRRIAAERRARREARRRAAAERRPTYISENEVRPPKAAPQAVKEAIKAANAIAVTPYIWGGGHSSFESSGYDCSGAVSYALHAAGLLETPLDSTGLSTWGEPGPGRWITVYANAGHAYAVIAGLRWDTSGDEEGTGPRWHKQPPYPDGYEVRHPPGY